MKSSVRLSRLLSDILDLSRIEAGRLSLCESAFVVKRLKVTIDELFAAIAKEKGLDLDFFVDDRMPEILMGDENRLVQILFNLVGNAIKFTKEGSVRVELTPLPYASQSRVRILFAVSDTGIGISDDQRKDIFDSFVQGEGSLTKHFQGAGLGLAIVRKLVTMLGGELAIDSIEGKGTTMFLSLPFKLPDARQGQAEPAAAVPRSSSADTQLKILFAEDDGINLMAGKLMLEKSGYAVVTAKDGQEALNRLAEQNFDLIITDIQMPVMDGVEATKLIRASGTSHANIPIIAMTAYTMAGDREKFLAAGVSDYIAKPVERKNLDAVIKRVLNMETEPATTNPPPNH